MNGQHDVQQLRRVGTGARGKFYERPGAVEFARRRLGFSPDEAQARVLDSPAKQGILNCTRQWGKSTVTAAKAVYEAYMRPESLILVVGPTERQSGEFVRKASEFAARLNIKAKSDGHNKISIAFGNRSRIIGLPDMEATVRCFSAVSLILIDEASRVSDEVYLAVRPMLAVSDGRMWLMSTPRGKSGFFYEAWEFGGDDWERFTVTAEECPRIPAEFLEREKRTMSERWYRQEFCCEFGEADDCVFDWETIRNGFTDDEKPLELGRK